MIQRAGVIVFVFLSSVGGPRDIFTHNFFLDEIHAKIWENWYHWVTSFYVISHPQLSASNSNWRRMVPTPLGRTDTKSPLCPPSSVRQECDQDNLKISYAWVQPPFFGVCVYVLLCFMNPILGNCYGPGVSSCQQTSDNNLGVAGSSHCTLQISWNTLFVKIGLSWITGKPIFFNQKRVELAQPVFFGKIGLSRLNPFFFYHQNDF